MIRPQVAGHEAAHAIVALALDVGVLDVDARDPDPACEIAWPVFRPDLWAVIYSAGWTWEQLQGFAVRDSCQGSDRAELIALAAWCSLREARAIAVQTLTAYGPQVLHLANWLERVGRVSGADLADWWHELPRSSNSPLTRANATPRRRHCLRASR